MKTERDLFNGWLKHYEKHDVVIDQLQRAFMWQAWQASAQREGYKLVPVENLIDIQVSCENAFEINNIDIFKGLALAIVDETKAMIGGAE